MRLAANSRWSVEYRFKASAAIGRRTNSALVASGFRTHLARLSNGAVRLSAIELNPRVNVVEQPAFGASQSVVRGVFVVESGTPIETSVLDMAFSEAVKGAGNPGFSATYIANAVPDPGGCGTINTFAIFHPGESVYEICRDATLLSATATTTPAPTVTTMDATIATVGASTVHSSTVEAEVGSKDAGLSTRLPQIGIDAWDSVPTGAKVGAVIVGSAIVLALFGYAFRSVK